MQRKNIIISVAVIFVLLGGILFLAQKITGLKIPVVNKKEQVLLIAEKSVRNASAVKKDASILFVGDMMFDRYIRQVAEKNGYAYSFQKVESILSGNDLVVGNLEGPITDNVSVSVDSKMGERNNYIFTFNPEFTKILADENIKLVNIGNNHITNFAEAGVESTRNYLAAGGIDFFGDPEKSERRVAYKVINGLKIAFVNYNQFVSNAKQKALEDIALAKQQSPDFIILYTHWGTEFKDLPEKPIVDLAHEFIDSGVDLIIGSHPHVVQSKEVYKGKTIYYSLGNFIFDQYFDPKTKKGLAVKVQLNANDKKMQFQEFAIEMKNGQTISLK